MKSFIGFTRPFWFAGVQYIEVDMHSKMWCLSYNLSLLGLKPIRFSTQLMKVVEWVAINGTARSLVL